MFEEYLKNINKDEKILRFLNKSIIEFKVIK